MHLITSLAVGMSLICGMAVRPRAEEPARQHVVGLTITTPLPADVGRIPMDPNIDFGELMRGAKLLGLLDPNSMALFDVATDTRPRCELSEVKRTGGGRPISRRLSKPPYEDLGKDQRLTPLFPVGSRPTREKWERKRQELRQRWDRVLGKPSVTEYDQKPQIIRVNASGVPMVSRAVRVGSASLGVLSRRRRSGELITERPHLLQR